MSRGCKQLITLVDAQAAAPEMAQLWNAAVPADLAIGLRGAEYNTCPAPGVAKACFLAQVDGAPVGFAFATALLEPELVRVPSRMGWLDALAVLPHARNAGVGGALLAQAQGWLREHACINMTLGGGLRPFMAGLPAQLGADAFFEKRGFVPRRENVWDVSRDLAGFVAPAKTFDSTFPRARIATPHDADAILDFLRRSFPGRWRYEFENYLQANHDVLECAIIETSAGVVEGFCRFNTERSTQPMDRLFHAGLPHPWGHVGPLGVSESLRGTGLGARVVNCALAHLAAQGIRGCIIDWTHLLAFYAGFGFAPFREYVMLGKDL
ncbi:MAG TPA: GNAT family N-acetyltransferase [Thermoflexales bacterium]|nr:GNAT family N-acetyltransferase [Thermoflexales bacterium]